MVGFRIERFRPAGSEQRCAKRWSWLKKIEVGSGGLSTEVTYYETFHVATLCRRALSLRFWSHARTARARCWVPPLTAARVLARRQLVSRRARYTSASGSGNTAG